MISHYEYFKHYASELLAFVTILIDMVIAKSIKLTQIERLNTSYTCCKSHLYNTIKTTEVDPTYDNT